MSQLVFNRYEKKYLMPESVYLALCERLKEQMSVDQYGLTTICNLYYDTPDDLLIRRSIERPKYKEKLRLRSYGIPEKDSVVFLEIKKKHKKIVNKRRIELTLAEAYDYLSHGIRPEKDCQILREIDFLLFRYQPEPKLYLAYDRIALYGKEDPQFRLTFDTAMPDNWFLMECKIQNSVPKWFSDLLAELKIYSTPFSKYGNIYKRERGMWDAESMMAHRLGNWKTSSLIDH